MYLFIITTQDVPLKKERTKTWDIVFWHIGLSAPIKNAFKIYFKMLKKSSKKSGCISRYSMVITKVCGK
jgi:hypothetical protein